MTDGFEDDEYAAEVEAECAAEFYPDFIRSLVDRGKVKVIQDSIAGHAALVLSGSEEEYREEERAVAEMLSGIYYAEGRLTLSAWLHERLNR